MPPPDHYVAEGWTHCLGEVGVGVPFLMLNYDDPHMRVRTASSCRVSWPGRSEIPFDDDGYHVPIVCLKDGHLFWMAKLKPVRLMPAAPTVWTFAEALAWPPKPPVPEVPRAEVETVYSFGHHDGPATGLVRWRGAYWYVQRAERATYADDGFFLVTLTPAQQAYALEYGAKWAELFHSGMSWNPDGTRVPDRIGLHARRAWNVTTCDDVEYRRFHEDHPCPSPDRDAAVVGYFCNWRLED